MSNTDYKRDAFQLAAEVNMMDGYEVVTHTEVPDRVSQITDLSIDAFAEMDARPCFDMGYTEWYLDRPGCRPERCVAALDGDRMVSMALVTVVDLQLGGRVLQCGVIDSVATHPRHREQGLAHRLMKRAHATLQDEGADLALVYTDPYRPAFELFQGLGYRNRAFFRLMRGGPQPPETRVTARVASSDEHNDLIELLDDFYEDYEGYAPLTEELWSWRKIYRAPVSDVQVLVAEAGEEIAAVCTGHLAVPLQAQPRPVTTISDFAWRPGYCDPGEALRAMLATAGETGFVTMADVADPVMRIYEAAGFSRTSSHAAMLLPISDDAEETLQQAPKPWYPMVESVIAV